ncbi:hypothetical protein ACKUT9_22465 [Mycobacterium seoulense]
MVVDVQRREHVVVVSMNRPAKMNAVNDEMAKGMSEAFDLLDARAIFGSR